MSSSETLFWKMMFFYLKINGNFVSLDLYHVNPSYLITVMLWIKIIMGKIFLTIFLKGRLINEYDKEKTKFISASSCHWVWPLGVVLADAAD